MSIKRLVLKNSLINLMVSVSERLGLTGIFIIVARYFSAESAGSYRLAMTYASILLALSLWGLDQLLIRDIAKNNDDTKHYLMNFAGLRLIISVVLWLMLTLAMPFLPYKNDSKVLILLMAITVIPGSLGNLYHSIWIAKENVTTVSVVLIIFSLIRVIGGALFLLLGKSLVIVVILLVLLSFLQTLILAWFTHRHPEVFKMQWRFDRAFLSKSLKVATPLIIASVSLLIGHQFDVVILSLFWPEEEVGVYGAAATILTLLLFLTRSYQLAVFPVISRAYGAGGSEIRRVFNKSQIFAVLAAIPVTIIITLTSRQIITFIYGPNYEAAAGMLSILAWAFLISAINISNSRLLIAANQQQAMAFFAVLSLGGNIILSLLLVPNLGGTGTALARVLAMPLYTIPAIWYVQRNIYRFSWREWLKLNSL